MLDKTKALLTVARHIKYVQQAITKVTNVLQERLEMHDISKLNDDEFEAVIHYQKLDGLAYGSEEYEEKMKEIKPFTSEGWNLHIKCNSHHPEHYENVEDMNFLDIIEMVCDWKGANKAYNTATQSFREGSLACMNKHNFNEGQKWLIHQLIDFLEED